VSYSPDGKILATGTLDAMALGGIHEVAIFVLFMFAAHVGKGRVRDDAPTGRPARV
jgi:hypothetical protein